MAIDIGLVSAVGGSLVGLAGIAATYLSGRRQASTALTVARLQAEHQAKLADRERKLRRLETEYERLLTWAFRIEEELWKTLPQRGNDDQDTWSRSAKKITKIREQVQLADLRKHSYMWSEAASDWFWELLDSLDKLQTTACEELSVTSQRACFGQHNRFGNGVEKLVLQVRAELVGGAPPVRPEEEPG